MRHTLFFFLGIGLAFIPMAGQARVLDQGTYQQIALQAQDPASSEAATDPVNHIFFDETTQKIIILSADADFTKEEESFAQFRRRYAVYWPLWLIMRGISALWVP